MTIEPINDNNTNFNNVIINNGTPHCIHHGAMNKVSVFNGGGYWRCISVVSKQNDNCCRSGCIQKK
jgi:hypothetical protein